MTPATIAAPITNGIVLTPATLFVFDVGDPVRVALESERLDAGLAAAALAATGAEIRAKPAEAIARDLMFMMKFL